MTRTTTILDGGMGKELRRIGAPFRQPEWSALALMETPDRVVDAHRNFIDAGAEVVTTNNYAVVPYHLGDDLFAERGRELVERAGRLARRAADESDPGVLVAGSLPPLFGSYEPDRFDAAAARPIYESIAEALAPHVDLWLGETLSSIAEMTTIVDVVSADRPCWISFAVPDAWDPAVGVALRSGETPAEIVDAASSLEVDALLVNCSLPEQTGPTLRALREALDASGLALRTGGYANAFPIERGAGYRANEVIFERRDDLTGVRYAEIVADWVDAGASIVGGCCDMYPEHIAALAERFA